MTITKTYDNEQSANTYLQQLRRKYIGLNIASVLAVLSFPVCFFLTKGFALIFIGVWILAAILASDRAEEVRWKLKQYENRKDKKSR